MGTVVWPTGRSGGSGVPVGVDDFLECGGVLVGLEVRGGGLPGLDGMEDGAHLGVARERRSLQRVLDLHPSRWKGEVQGFGFRVKSPGLGKRESTVSQKTKPVKIRTQERPRNDTRCPVS